MGGVLSILGDAYNIPLDDSSCATIFCSHMIEHIPHTRLEHILLEFNRILEKDGIVRLLSPNLKTIAKAYVEEDKHFFEKALEEDENIRTDLGYGGMFMNFVVSPGQDTALFNRQLNEFISGYAHIYLYDFHMLKVLLERCGFSCIEQKGFCESDLSDYQEPLHVDGMEAKWQNMNQKFYKENGLVHYYDEKTGIYNINFKVTGFDRDPLTSLIVEAKKERHIDHEKYVTLEKGKDNYNRYGQSLLKDKQFSLKKNLICGVSSIIDNET